MTGFLLLGIATLAAAGQTFAYHAPDASRFTVMRSVRFGEVEGARLEMDVFRPAGAAAPAPALIFSFQATGDDRTGFFNGFYKWWAELAASRGVVGVLADLRGATATADLEALLAHLTEHGAAYGIDPERVAIYGASSNAFRVFPFVENPSQSAIKAAVIYYGAADIDQFRLDVPVLFVRAGLDRPELNRDVITLASRALEQNAPLTIINHPSGYHGFEIFNADAATRDVIDRTLDFVKHATAPAYRAAVQAGLQESTAAAQVVTGNFAAAAETYASLIDARPDDARLRLSYGEALLGAGRFGEACGEFAKLQGKGLGPRDLGLPAARACAQHGDADAAIAWLMSIPARFLPQTAQLDPAFASIRERADFKAAFQPR